MAIVINRHWSWGDSHVWHDGPHCVFSVGPLHIHYTRLGWRCKC
jgi:hypothetical protein